MLKRFQIFGANTDVGKTIFTTALCKYLAGIGERVSYLKPIQTGDDYDHKHISRNSQAFSENIFHYKLAASPHLSANISRRELISGLSSKLSDHSKHFNWTFVETAGGVLTPGPENYLQADLYRPLRLPSILVADPNLGGISATISAYESLKTRGYDIVSILSFNKSKSADFYGNLDFFQSHFGSNKVFSLDLPPEGDLTNYYSEVGPQMEPVVDFLESYTKEKHDYVSNMAAEAEKIIWYPFSQHKEINKNTITTIDSAYGNDFYSLSKDKSEIVPQFDGSASWWTQGLGHGNSTLALAAAEAGGRYGHVILANTIHEPALELAKKVLKFTNNPKLSRVFYSDNGSTGIEVAIKMALKSTCVRYGWDVSDGSIGVLGLKGSYHGDTIGAMDCSEPSVFNKQITWYKNRGFWFDYPTVTMKKGRWIIDFPEGLPQVSKTEFETIESVFDLDSRDPTPYKDYIKSEINRLSSEGYKFGALMLEPVLLGAGGMKSVDPLFQHALVEAVREIQFDGNERTVDENSWSGLPVIYDEVFTGMYRLGKPSSTSFIKSLPDISVHAKVLTGGTLPLCITTASDSIFNSFLSDGKADALLHGHSYTANPIACNVALASLETLKDCKTTFWGEDFIDKLSFHPGVDGVFALGTVLAIHLKDSNSGYQSTIGAEFHQKLRSLNIHTRPLGNVVYFMCGHTSSDEDIKSIQDRIKIAFDIQP